MEFSPVKDFWKFINFPTRDGHQEKVPRPFLYVNVLFITAFAINIIAMALVNTLIVDLGEIGNVFDDLDYGFWAMFGIAVVAAPLAEELIFRFPLRNKWALSVLLGIIVAGFIGVICTGQGYLDLAYVLAPSVFVIMLLALLFNRSAWERWKVSIDSYYPYLFFLVAAFFGFIHIYNYDASAFSWWMVPMIVIPQFVLALFLGFARLRVGFWACIYMHALNNFIPTILFFLVKDLPVG